MHICLSWEAPWYAPRRAWIADLWSNASESGFCLLGLSARKLHTDAAGVTLEVALYAW